MILSRNIPLNVQAFLNNVDRDYKEGLHSSDYRELLVRETKIRYPGLIEGLSRIGKTSRGMERVLADADHILPRSLWKILIPLAWYQPGDPTPTPDVLSNLFWRTVGNNRGSEKRGDAFDQTYIRHYLKESAQYTGKTPASSNWARAAIAFFLQTKHDEGVNVDVPIDPRKVDEMREGVDVSNVIAFIQKVREARPRITRNELIKLVETKFPFLTIEIDSRGPRIELG